MTLDDLHALAYLATPSVRPEEFEFQRIENSTGLRTVFKSGTRTRDMDVALALVATQARWRPLTTRIEFIVPTSDDPS